MRIPAQVIAELLNPLSTKILAIANAEQTTQLAKLNALETRIARIFSDESEDFGTPEGQMRVLGLSEETVVKINAEFQQALKKAAAQDVKTAFLTIEQAITNRLAALFAAQQLQRSERKARIAAEQKAARDKKEAVEADRKRQIEL